MSRVTFATAPRVRQVHRWSMGAVLGWLLASAASGQAPDVATTEPLAHVRAAAEAFIREQISKSTGISTISVGALDSRLRLMRCATPLLAALPVGAAVQARMTVGVSCSAPSKWTIYVPVTVETRIDMLVLRRSVPRDAHIGPDDVTVEQRIAPGPGAAYLTAMDQLNGRSTRRPLAVGTALAVDMFAADLVVRHGQAVTLMSSGGPLEVRASGRALTDGAVGSRIQVQNLSSSRIVEGVVETADLVRVAIQ